MPSCGPLPSELSVSIAVSVPSFTSNSSLSTPTLASVSSPSLPSPAVLSPSLPCIFSTVQPYSPYSPSDTLQTSPASHLPLRYPSLPEQSANVYVPPPTLVSGIPVQGSVSYTPTPLIELCRSVAATSDTAFLSYSASLSCSASLNSSASLSSSASQATQPSTVPMATAAVSELLVIPRTSVQTETLGLSLLSS